MGFFTVFLDFFSDSKEQSVKETQKTVVEQVRPAEQAKPAVPMSDVSRLTKNFIRKLEDNKAEIKSRIESDLGIKFDASSTQMTGDFKFNPDMQWRMTLRFNGSRLEFLIPVFPKGERFIEFRLYANKDTKTEIHSKLVNSSVFDLFKECFNEFGKYTDFRFENPEEFSTKIFQKIIVIGEELKYNVSKEIAEQSLRCYMFGERPF